MAKRRIKTGPLKYRRPKVLPFDVYKDRVVLSPALVRMLQIVMQMADSGKPISIKRLCKRCKRLTIYCVKWYLARLRRDGFIVHEPGEHIIWPCVRYIPADQFFAQEFPHDQGMQVRRDIPTNVQPPASL